MEVNYKEQKGENLMKKLEIGIRYADGVPATVRKQYWSQSPWKALWLTFRHV